MPAAGRLREALFFRLRHVRIGVRRGKDQFFAIAGKETARGASAAWADASPFPLVEPLDVNLIEGVADRICLIANQLPIRREIAFASAWKAEGHLSQVREVLRLERSQARILCSSADRRQRERQQAQAAI